MDTTCKSELSTLLRQHSDEVVRAWTERARALPAAYTLSGLMLLDHIPALLERLSDAIDRGDRTSVAMDQIPLIHARTRWSQGYDLRQVVAEYRILRQAILEVYHAHHGETKPDLAPFFVLHEAIDHAITDSVDQFSMERDRARDMFAAILGHDLRNPLNAIATGAQLLLEQAPNDDAARVLTRVVGLTGQMTRLIRDLLDFARGRLGSSMPITPQATDLRQLLPPTVAAVAAAHRDREIVCLALTTQGNLSGEWDPDRIAQAVSNLLNNALLHGKDPVIVEPQDRGDQGVSIEVRNGGVIPPDLVPHLFEPFETRRRQQPGHQGGSGLGSTSSRRSRGPTAVRSRSPARRLPVPPFA